METGDPYEPYRLVGADGAAVVPAAVFFQELLAAGKTAATVRSYGMDLLRWWRFLHEWRAAGEGGPPGSRGRPTGHTGSITQRDAVLMVGWKTTVAPTLPFASKYFPLQSCLMDFGLPDVVVHFWYAPPLQGNV